MRVFQELLTSTEGQFAIGVIGITFLIGAVMLVVGLRKSAQK
jgi:hypothetical protein